MSIRTVYKCSCGESPTAEVDAIEHLNESPAGAHEISTVFTKGGD